MAIPVRDAPQRFAGYLWRELKDFSAWESDATHLWTRWLILRAVGLVYLLIFGNIIAESAALIGPEGVAPLSAIMDALRELHPNAVVGFLRAPSLFWLSHAPGMITLLQWTGCFAAAAVVLNLWPRLALFVAWACFLSFVALSHFFSATQPDQLMLEVALLCIPFAPAGLRPGLGVGLAPRRIAVFALRWMLIRLMFEAGLAKFVFGAAMWRDFTAMDVMYETAPFPTIIGFAFHQLPHAFHILEILITFIAEIPAPFLAVFGGRWGRWVAFWSWCALQGGIQVTCNFGWLNVAAIALGLVLLDDQMLAGLLRRIGLGRLGDRLLARAAGQSIRPSRPWAKHGLRWALGAQFALGLYFHLVSPNRIPVERVPAVIHQPIDLLFGSWRSMNSYALFGNLPTVRYDVEFMGSNDGGETWRSYEYFYKVQRVDRIPPFIAPWYPRFEAILQSTMISSTDPTLYQSVAAQLLRRSPPVMAKFRRDPFPDRPPTMVRIPTYRYEMNDFPTFRATGHYWRKEYVGDYTAMMYLDARGEVAVRE